ncbi:MAG: MarR family winged helix-turn-helix transcriptional regulator [Candidatus Bipolaricaulota bacterium]
MRDKGKEHDISSTQIQTIIFLSGAHTQNKNVSSISKRLQIAQPTASRMVDSLVEKGLVKRERSQADRRKVKLELTEKGESITDNVNEISYTIQELVEGFEEERQNELSQDLVDIAGKLQRQGHLSTALTCRYCRFFERNGGSSDERPHHCKLTGEDLTEEESYSEWVHEEGKIDLMAR